MIPLFSMPTFCSLSSSRAFTAALADVRALHRVAYWLGFGAGCGLRWGWRLVR